MPIHPTAIIDPRAEIAPDVAIGPYVVIEGPARIGSRTRVGPRATILGCTTIGEDNEIHTGAVLGDTPQDLAYKGQESYLRIGDRNVFREFVQVHRGTVADSETIIGHDNFFMATSHIAHNCRVGNHNVLANSAMLGGYVEVADRVFLSANCLVHQFTRIGEFSIMRGLSGTSRDVPPFSIIDWQHTVRGVNVVGLKRVGFDERRIRVLREAFRILFHKGKNLSLAVAEVEATFPEPTDDVVRLLEFIRSSTRGVCMGR
jgi:UDP-N-acetylglucosamine acyltransferase